MAKKKLKDLFKAIADPSRRQVLHILLISEALTIHEIASKFESRRQAVTKHINTLSEAGLVAFEISGREKI